MSPSPHLPYAIEHIHAINESCHRARTSMFRFLTILNENRGQKHCFYLPPSRAFCLLDTLPTYASALRQFGIRVMHSHVLPQDLVSEQ